MTQQDKPPAGEVPMVRGRPGLEGGAARSNSLRAFSFVFTLVRVPLFLVLCWLRVPVVMLCNLVSAPALFCFLFAWFAFPEKTHMVVGLGVLSFAAFAMGWLYDFILAVLSPEDTVRML